MEENLLSYANLANVSFLEELYRSYVKDPKSIDPSWQGFFAGMELAYEGRGVDFRAEDVCVFRLIEAYQKYGHRKNKINPLASELPKVPELELDRFGLSQQDLAREVFAFGLLSEERGPLSRVIQVLEEKFCSGIGFEIEGLSEEIDSWVRAHLKQTTRSFSKERLLCLLEDVMQAELFEAFLHARYPGQTRFSLEGAETLIPLLDFLLEIGGESGVEEVVLGMSHRGRLNVICHVLEKSCDGIFREFEDRQGPCPEDGFSGDVKYHKGVHSIVQTRGGKSIAVTLASNPSHLESVGPVIEGKVRAKQDLRKHPLARNKVIPILIHGDAAIAGQGVVYETMQLAKLPGYETGGTIHIVVNNYIGYTTLPQESRSTLYCTDIAKAFNCPVFHVNAERPDECLAVGLLAMQIRQKFHIDVFIDMGCYRKYGHNEGDEPTFTQPKQYQLIRQKKSIRHLVQAELIHKGMLTKEEVLHREEIFNAALKEGVSRVLEKGEGEKKEKLEERPVQLGASLLILRQILQVLSHVPAEFHLHPKLKRILQERASEEKIDWATAEQLALGSLLVDEVSIRFCGQDVCRGTFSQRHAVLIDQETGEKYIPLAHLSDGQAPCAFLNSSLSEFAVMGFDLGYSYAHPRALVVWEAQFGDFVNGAQVILDQYLVSGEQKWGQRSNFTLLLPHGYEGKGPEHSSARIERFLQLSAQENLYIANCTTPAQFFHLLRRQGLLVVKKPLIVFTPKLLLRHSECTSCLEDLATGGFQLCLDDPSDHKGATRVLLCSGKVYYDLVQERTKKAQDFVAIIRIEQLYPFPQGELRSLFKNYPKAKEFFYIQEEPKNMGAWGYVSSLWQELFSDYPLLRFIGRKESASPAVGSSACHKKQLEDILQKAYSEVV